MRSQSFSGVEDWRAFESGKIKYGGRLSHSLPADHHYREGLSVIKISDSVHLRAITVARQREGDPTQHIMAQKSLDGGQTWGEWFDVEPDGPPMTSYGSFTRHPKTGRVYFIYELGPENPRPPLADGSPFRGHPHHVGKVVMRYVNADGDFSERHILAIPQAEIDKTNVFNGRHEMFYIKPAPQWLSGGDGYGYYTKLGPEVDVGQGEAFLLRFIGYADNDALHELPIELLPEGGRGIQAPGSPSVAEFGPIYRDGQDMAFKFRTTAGFAGIAESHDGGRSFTAGFMRYMPDGDLVKNPEGPLTIARDGKGRIYLSFYNNSEALPRWSGRDLVWLSQIRIIDGALHLTQPELLVYRRDQEGQDPRHDTRLNCARFTPAEDGVISQITDKLESRSFPVPAAFLDMIESQYELCETPERGLVVRHHGPLPASLQLPSLNLLNEGRGMTLAVSFDGASPGSMVSAWENDHGFTLKLTDDGGAEFTLSDGGAPLALLSDPGALRKNGANHVAVMVDGQARIITMVVNERLQDGGNVRGRGSLRIPLEIAGISCPQRCDISATNDAFRNLHVYDRPLFTTEAIGLQRAIAAHND